MVRQRAAVPLPLPDEYGSYSYEINLLDTPVPAVYFAPAPSVYRSSSPFGAHYHSSDPAFAHHAGIWWWRNHDVYGRWNFYLSSAGKTDWSDYEERLEFVRRNQLRECSVYLGAPRQYSTILPGEPVTGDLDWLYSYYPPADLDAWRRLYLTPMAEKIKQASPFRAHEVWNEAWSYYRLRGPHGTAGEAAALFRSSYETLKRVDPEALVYATDVKPEATENPYAYRNFGRDLFDLGFLRYTDLLSYHSYGIMSYPRLEQLRRNLWAYGRDYDLWSTETAVEGKPFPALLESLGGTPGGRQRQNVLVYRRQVGSAAAGRQADPLPRRPGGAVPYTRRCAAARLLHGGRHPGLRLRQRRDGGSRALHRQRRTGPG